MFFCLTLSLFGQGDSSKMVGDFYYLEIENDKTYLGIIRKEDVKTITVETQELRLMQFRKSDVIGCELVTHKRSKKRKKCFKKSKLKQTQYREPEGLLSAKKTND